ASTLARHRDDGRADQIDNVHHSSRISVEQFKVIRRGGRFASRGSRGRIQPARVRRYGLKVRKWCCHGESLLGATFFITSCEKSIGASSKCSTRRRRPPDPG